MLESFYEREPEYLIPVSALQHFVFCPRQCALIHIEQVWADNVFTVEGRIMHERVHELGGESGTDGLIERGLPLRSMVLGLIGMADVVEFQNTGKGYFQPFPVEYKRGKPKPDHSDEIQLCAQAICLEEMTGIPVPQGAIFYGKTRHRHNVYFTTVLRKETELTVFNVRDFLAQGNTPLPTYGKRCRQCSLIDLCLPKAISVKKDIERYLSEVNKE